jgi:hypothetical protein
LTLKQITRHPALLSGNAEERLAEAKKIRDDRLWIEPTEDLGGISLNAVADVPFDSRDVIHATFDSRDRHIVLTMRNGPEIAVALPNLSNEALRAIYRSVYVDDERPEISIGSRPASDDKRLDDQEKRRAADGVPVYYLGGIEGTELGRALFRADEALSELAFGPTATVREVEDKVVGFHSLPELFVEKYAHHEAQNRYLGSSTVYMNLQRVQIAPVRPVWWRFLRFASRVDYEISPPIFAVRFGQGAGPAEAAFAAFFTSHFYEIAETEVGRPFRDLLPFAQTVALFRWLRANDISLDPGPLGASPARIDTPLVVAHRRVVRPSDVSPSAPGILFNSFGPSEIYDATGRKSVVRYSKGLPVEVQRHDGATLRVVRDSLGTPVVMTDGVHSQTFDVNQEIGLVLANDVALKGEGVKIATAFTTNTVIYPLSQREPEVGRAIAGFLASADRSWSRVED